MPRKKTQPAARKVIGVSEQNHAEIMSLGKKAGCSADDVLSALVANADNTKVVAHLKAEKKSREEAKKAQRARREQLVEKLAKLDDSEVAKLLKSV